MTSGVISLELNELNMELVEAYAESENLENFRWLLTGCRRWHTRAEEDYERLEPWIQWVTAHTGKSFAQHGIFRLGDIRESAIEQIWESVEKLGGTVGAVSPINSANRTSNAEFFVPDPWTDSPVTGSWDLRLLHEGVHEAVNENATGSTTALSYLKLLLGASANLPRKRMLSHALFMGRAVRNSRQRAVCLDVLLAEAFIRHWTASKPTYASLFLNAAAHLQHHYMFNSKHYRGGHSNPPWYIADEDPFEVLYTKYDEVLGWVRHLAETNGARLLVCTALGQVPNPNLIFYYRPKQHGLLLERLGISGVTEVHPRMSRDFLVEFQDTAAAKSAESVLLSVQTAEAEPFFAVDNRGPSLFVQVCHTRELHADTEIRIGDRRLPGLSSMFAHVSIENAIHSPLGAFFDCSLPPLAEAEEVPLEFTHGYTLQAARAATDRVSLGAPRS